MDNKLANDQLFYFILFKLCNHWKRRDLNAEFLNLLETKIYQLSYKSTLGGQ